MRPLTLSRSIRQGDRTAPGRCTGSYIVILPAPVDALPVVGSCVIGAAFLGQLYGPADVQKFMGFAATASREGLCDFVHHGVMKAFPQLGESIRVKGWPEAQPDLAPLVTRHTRAAADLFRASYSAPAQGKRTVEFHRSLFGVLTALHDQHGWSKAQLAGVLERAGL